MPRRLRAFDGPAFRIVAYDLPPLAAPRDVRVRVTFGAPKHGTELHGLSGSVFDRKRFDWDLRLFLSNDADPNAAALSPSDTAGRSVGNMVVGTVLETGADVTLWSVGDRVFGYGALAEVVQSGEENWHPLGELSDADAVCADPAHVAFVAVRDGNIRIGDDVAVFGLGAIGLLAVQVARAGGARRIYVTDPLPARRAYALAHGADVALDPTDGSDIALAIKRDTDGMGVDVSLETSGNGRALHEAIRCIRQCGTVVHVAWGPKSGADLHLDEEFHMNRPTLIASQAAPYWRNPDRDYPLWMPDRAFHSAIDLLRRHLITGDGLVTPIVPFDAAPDALANLLAHTENAIKLGVTFEG